MQFQNRQQVIAAGCGEWVEGVTGAGADARKMVANGVWTAADTYVLTLRYYETPFYDTHTFVFDGDRLLLNGGINVAFGTKEYPTVKGKLAR